MRALSNGVRQAAPSLRTRVASLDWPRIEAELDERGCAQTGALLTPRECTELVRGYDSEEAFRSRVEMTRHGFGRGEYEYFAYPLPTWSRRCAPPSTPGSPRSRIAGRGRSAATAAIPRTTRDTSIAAHAEQRPRTQSRAEVVSLAQGEGVIFAVNERPARGARGVYRVVMRHGVSRLRSGRRFTIGIIFHDAT